jgi:hypothetical protein
MEEEKEAADESTRSDSKERYIFAERKPPEEKHIPGPLEFCRRPFSEKLKWNRYTRKLFALSVLWLSSTEGTQAMGQIWRLSARLFPVRSVFGMKPKVGHSHRWLLGLAFGCCSPIAALAQSYIHNPTAGDVVIFPGPVDDWNFGAGLSDQRPGRWNIPGRFFRPGTGWSVLACADKCTLSSTKLNTRPGTHGVYADELVKSQILTWRPLPFELDKWDDTPGAPRSPYSPSTYTPGHAVVVAIFKPIRSLVDLPITGERLVTWFHRGMAKPPWDLPEKNGQSAVIAPSFSMVQRLQRIVRNDPQMGTVLQLVIRNQEVQQVLGNYEFHLDAPATYLPTRRFLVWAGDLDGDGKADLLVNFTSFWWHTTLFLSSLAKPGALVGRAGTFRYYPPDIPGC